MASSCVLAVATFAGTQIPAHAQTGGTTTPPKVLALYDAPSGTPWDKLGFAYAIMLRNLLGHFDAQVELLPVQQYAAGQMEGFHATFYLGAAYDHQLPAAFLSDEGDLTARVAIDDASLAQLGEWPWPRDSCQRLARRADTRCRTRARRSSPPSC